MKKTIGYLTMIALMTALFGSYAAAQPPGHGGYGRDRGEFGMGEGFRGPGARGLTPPRWVLENVLELTDEQLDALEALKTDHRAAMRPLREERRELGKGLKAALASENPDATAVGESVIAIHDLGEQMKLASADFGTAFEALLTEDQLQALQEWKENPKRGRGRGRGPHRPGR